MKLSEAIMMNGMTKPQGFGPDSVYSVDAPCVIGGALQVMGEQTPNRYEDHKNYGSFYGLWPWTKNKAVCPLGCSSIFKVSSYSHIIFHLNDLHRWTRAQIAAWVASVEPREEEVEERVTEEAKCATICSE